MTVPPALQQLGDYRLIRPLGSGGMGDVYFGVSPTADRVAVKVIRRHLLSDPTMRQRFAAEVESLQVVWGSRAARLEAADPLGDPAWLAVEYVPGSTLMQHVEQRGPCMHEQGRIWELYPDASDPVTAAETELMRLADQRSELEGKLRGLDAINGRLEDPNQPRAYLLGVSTEGDGKAIVSVGNPDLADNVLTYVPGTGSDLSKVGGDIDRANRMALDANATDRSATTAAVFWLGYDAPNSIPQAGQSGFAEDGGKDLGGFQTGLRVTHEGDTPARNTVLGHSYGSTVIGHGAMSSSINADALVFVGSPGVDVNHANELTGVHPSQVYATRAEHDMIARIPDWDIIHGNDPTRDDFGASVFASNPGDPDDEAATHSKYWDEGNVSRDNIAFIATGQTEKLT